MSVADTLNAITGAATALGVAVAAWQLWLNTRQSRVTFEDALTREYRDIAQHLPLQALLGEPLNETDLENSLHLFYRYIDLTNEQLFLRQRRRIGSYTWRNWRDGITMNMSLPVFQQAWSALSKKPVKRFSELGRAMDERFTKDPRQWSQTH
jgi:hypothetical protein